MLIRRSALNTAPSRYPYSSCVHFPSFHFAEFLSRLKYLGIPLVAGVVTRAVVCLVKSKTFFETKFLPIFSPLSLIGLVYTILVMFAYQGHHILHNLRPVFRVFVPMILYFVVMWSTAFGLSYYLGVRKHKMGPNAGYEMAVVQSFTAGSNNFVSVVCPRRRLFNKRVYRNWQ